MTCGKSKWGACSLVGVFSKDITRPRRGERVLIGILSVTKFRIKSVFFFLVKGEGGL